MHTLTSSEWHPNSFKKYYNELNVEFNFCQTFFKKPLKVGHKLVVTLRHLAAGDNYPSLQFNFWVARSSITQIISRDMPVVHHRCISGCGSSNSLYNTETAGSVESFCRKMEHVKYPNNRVPFHCPVNSGR